MSERRRREVDGVIDDACLDLSCSTLERWFTGQEDVGDYAHAPDVDFFAVILLDNDLGGHVHGTAQ